MHRFDYRPGEQDGEIAVYMVRNGRVHPLLCASHPAKNRGLSPSYLFRDEAFRNRSINTVLRLNVFCANQIIKR